MTFRFQPETGLAGSPAQRSPREPAIPLGSLRQLALAFPLLAALLDSSAIFFDD